MSSHLNAQLRDLWTKTSQAGRGGALATVVDIVGSSYQPLGARMVIAASGEWAGTVSGGCLEADVLRRARDVIASGEPAVVVYDATGEADVPLGFNLGCQGRVTVLIEALERADALLAFLGRCRDERRAAVVGTVIAGAGVGRRLGLGRDDLPWDELKRQHAADVMSEGCSQVVVYARETVLWEYVPAPVSLLLCGAGEDARPLSSMAMTLNWDVTVADHRPAYLTAARFPYAHLALWQDDPETVTWRPNGTSGAVLMTHHFERDLALLTWLLETPCPYLGVLGPKQRTQRLLAALPEEVRGDAELRLHAPVGLDIGADTPEAIALAILAEAHAVLAGRSGAFLRATPGPLHRRQQALVASGKAS